MAKQLNIDMSVRADTSQAKKAMMDLQKSLDTILSKRTITIDDTSINQAKQAAMDLKHHLAAATDVNTGKLDLSKFSASLNKSGQSLQGLYNNLSQIGPEGQSAFLALSQSIAKADASAISLGSKLGGLMTTLKNTAKWQISSSLLHGFMGAIQSAYGYAQDLNQSLNNIRIITGQNIDQMAQFAKEANSAAKALSTTTTEYTNASLIYYQQGLPDEEVKARTDATIKMANVTRQSAEEVSSQMTAIWNNFAEGAENLEYYEDVVTKLGATTASSSKEILDGLSKFAAVSKTVDLSYEKASAALATVVAETRQSADTVGNAFKTLFARVEGLKLGETLEDGVDLNKYSKALDTVGVKILDANKQIKSMDDILDELGAKWNSIGKSEQIALAQTVAGVRQYTQFIALMNNYDKVQKNEDIARGSTGTIQEQADIYAEGWEAARDRVTAAAEEIYDQLLNDEAFIDILNGFEKFLEFISNIIDGLGGLKGILLLIGSIFMQQYAKEMPAFIEKMTMNIRILTGEEEKRRQAMLKENADIINNQMGKSGSAEVDIQIAGMKKISTMYADLAAKRKSLSQAEIASYENLIKETEARTQVAQAIGRQIDEIKKETDALETQLNGQMGYAASKNFISSTIESKNFKGNKETVNEGVAAAGLMSNDEEAKKLETLREEQLIYDKIQKLKNLGRIDTDKLTDKEKEVLNSLNSQTRTVKDINKEIQGIQNNLNQKISGKKLFETFKTGAAEIGKVQTVINHVTKKTDIWTKKMDAATNSPEKMDALKKEMIAFADEMDKAGMETDQLRKDIDQLGKGDVNVQTIMDSFKNLNEEGISLSADRLEKVKQALVNLGMNEDKLNELQLKLQQGGQAAEEARAELKRMAQQIDELPKHGIHASEAFAKLGSSLMQISMAFNAIKNIGNIWNDENLTEGEKILQTMTALGTLIPTLITLKKTLTIANLKEGASAIYLAAAENGAKIAKALGIPIDYAKGKSGWAALGPAIFFVGIAAVIIGLIAGITIGIMSLINAETEEEKASRLANEELERSKKAAEEAKQAYQDLKDKISNYDDAVKALEECTKGTQEWRDAFQEVMNQISEIIAAYPQLLQYSDLFNNDGTFNKQRLEEILKLSQNIAAAASSTQIKNTAKVEQATLDEKTAKKIDELKKSNELYDYDVQERENVEKTYVNTLDNGLQEEIGASQIMEAVSQAIITNSQDINFNDVNNKALKDYISNYIQEHYDLASSDFIEATTDISNALLDSSEDLRKLGEETDNLATKMHNASNTAFENLFADKKFKNENEEIAYQEAYQEKEKEIKTSLDKAQAAGHAGGYSSKGTMRGNHADYAGKEYDDAELEKILEIYEKQHPELAGKRSANNYKEWRDGNAFIRYAGQKKEDQKTVEEIAAEVYPILLAQAKEEIEENASKQNYNKDINAQDYFATKGNFDKISYDELKKSFLDNDNKIKNLDDLFGNDKEAKKEYAAKVLGIDKDDITEKNYEEKMQEANQFIEKQASMAIASLDTIPTFLNKYLSDDLIHKIDLGSLENVGNMYTKILASGGEEGLSILNNIIAKSGDEADEVLSALSNMDLTTMNAKDVNAALADLGLNFQLTETEIYSLGNMLRDTSTMTAEAAQETYKTISSILSKLKEEGDIIDQKDYEELMKLNPALSSYFTMMADGTYMLIGAAQDFKTAAQRSLIYQMEQTINNQQRIADAYGTLAKEAGFSADEITSAKIEVLSDNATTKQEAEYYKASIAAGKELSDVHSQVAASYDKLGLSEEDFAAKAKTAIEQVDKLTIAMKESQFQFELSSAGLDYETTENYAEVLMDVHKAEGLSKDAARELAIANQRLDRGLTSLNDNFEQWSSNLKNNSRETAEYAQTIGDLRKAFADLLNIADGNELSLSWIEKQVNNADEMAKILDGDIEAIQRFKESAFVEMTNNVFDQIKESAQEMLEKIEDIDDEAYDSLEKLINQLETSAISASGLREAIENISNSEIGSGAVLSEEYTKALNIMLQQGLLAEQQLNDIFASIGYKPKVTTELIDQMTEIPVYETVETVYEDTKPQPMYVGVDDGKTRRQEYIGTKPGTYRKRSYTKQVDSKFMSQKVPVIQIEDSKTAGGNIEIVNAGTKHITPSYSSTTSGKNSDSGSGSKSSNSTPTTKAASHNHEVNRYSNEENALKGLSDQYKRLNDAKDKAFGQGRIKMIEQEISKLRDLKKASSDYLDTIVGSGNSDKVMKALYYGEDIGKLITSGQLGGTIGADYRSLYNGADASGKNLEYTAKDSDGNEWLVSDNYSLAGFNSLFGSNLSFTFDSFGNIVGQDAIKNFLQELKNQEEDSYSSVADPDANSTTLHNKRLAYLEAIENRLDQFNDTAEKLSDQVDSRLEYISQLQEKNAELISAKLEYGNQIDESLTKTLDRSLKVLGDKIYKTPEAMNEYFANQQERIKMANDSIARYRENLAEIEYRNSLYNQPGGQFNPEALSDSKAAELYSEIEDKIDAEIDIIQEAEEALSDYYSNLLDSLNKDISNITKKIEFNAKILDHYQKVAELTGRETDYEFLGKIIQGQIDVSEQAFLANQKMANVAEQSYNRWQQEYDKAIANNEPAEALEDITKHMEEAYDEMQTRQEQAMESYVSYLEKANAKFQNDVNKIFADFEKKNSGIYGNFELMDKAIERQKSLSEDYLTKTNQIYETNSLLRKLNQDINKTDSVTAKQKLKAFSDEITSMKEQEKLSKTDLEIAKARYEVLQAEIALRDAQNAKSVVRLQRDSEGNYGYVYTADQDRIAEAEQTVEDKQNALYNLVLNYANDYSEKLIQLEREHEEALKELANNTALSDEERNAERARIDEYFLNKRQALLDTHNKAMVYLDQLAAEGRAEAWSESFSQTIKDQDEYKEEFDNLMDNLEDKMNEVNELRERHAQEARVDNKSVEQSIDNITKSTQRLGDQITKKGGLADQYSILREKADNLTSTTSTMRDEFNRSISVLKNLADKAGELYRNLDSAAEAQRDYNKAVAEAPSGSGTTTYGSNSSSGSSSGGSSNNSGNGTIPQSSRYSLGYGWNNAFHWIRYSDGTKGTSEVHNWRETSRTNLPSGEIYTQNECSVCGAISQMRKASPSSKWEQIRLSKSSYKTGGYTGTWTSGKTGMYTGTWNGPDLEENGKLAFLHQKELVLNAEDTENVLSAVKMIRQISQTIDLQAAAQSSSFQAVAARITGNDQTLQQEVTIHAEFPNVNDHNEIEEAFNNLINRASQYANRS